mmetsp:Transcript_39237/g.116716  ORF Transcript_39237/g.116716 Transcript_39237/m.116716 type:complete len:211 (-) Transcript_39237:206-838(-)
MSCASSASLTIATVSASNADRWAPPPPPPSLRDTPPCACGAAFCVRGVQLPLSRLPCRCSCCACTGERDASALPLAPSLPPLAPALTLALRRRRRAAERRAMPPLQLHREARGQGWAMGPSTRRCSLERLHGRADVRLQTRRATITCVSAWRHSGSRAARAEGAGDADAADGANDAIDGAAAGRSCLYVWRRGDAVRRVNAPDTWRRPGR